MTRSAELIREIRSELPSIKAVPRHAPLLQLFDDNLLALSSSLGTLRKLLVQAGRNPAEVRSAMSKASSDLGEVEQVYQDWKRQVRSVLGRLGRQGLRSTFESVEEKANQLFNILTTVLKNEQEAQSGIVRNIL